MIRRKLSNNFSSQWVKVRFYKEKPDLKYTKSLKDIRFCEAMKEAVISPVLLDRESISCPGAQYAFGWNPDYKNVLAQSCLDKWNGQKCMLKPMLSRAPFFKKPFKYIGLNTEGEPDLVISCMSAGEIMKLLKIYHARVGKNLDVSLSTMMSICGGIAVRTYLEGTINLSFGCDDSRKYADMRRDALVVGIPKQMFKLFID